MDRDRLSIWAMVGTCLRGIRLSQHRWCPQRLRCLSLLYIPSTSTSSSSTCDVRRVPSSITHPAMSHLRLRRTFRHRIRLQVQSINRRHRFHTVPQRHLCYHRHCHPRQSPCTIIRVTSSSHPMDTRSIQDLLMDLRHLIITHNNQVATININNKPLFMSTFTPHVCSFFPFCLYCMLYLSVVIMNLGQRSKKQENTPI